MLFDQYQRYKNAEIVINSIRRDGEKFNILEVGANEHKNLERFLPNDRVTYLDIVLSEERKKDPAYILGDASEMDFENCSYDIIVALDIYEHILPERRKAFLSEINRVSSRLFVIGAPFDTDGVSESEKRVNNVYRCLYGGNHPWLIEHIENGLPRLNQTLDYLNEIGCKVSVFSHGNLRLWERLTNIELASDIDKELLNYADNIYDIYRKFAFEADYGKNSYRQFIVGVKDTYKFDLNLKNNGIKWEKQFNGLEQQFWILHENVKRKQEISLLKDMKYEECFSIYFDEGYGFTEDRKKSIPLDENRVVIKISCSEYRNVQRIRIDPINASGIVKINKISFANQLSERVCEITCDIHTENCIFSFENKYGFGDDAQIIIPVTGMKIETIEVDYEYYSASVRTIHKFHDLTKQLTAAQEIINYQNRKIDENRKQLKSCNDELENYKTHYFAAIAQREDLSRQLQAINQAYYDISNSECWKLTKPVRVVLHKIAIVCGSNRALYLIAKGMITLFTSGPRATWIKCRSYHANKQAMRYSEMNLTKEERQLQKSREFEENILFSIIVPLYNTPQSFLKEMIESVQDQTYSKWELCLADGSDEAHTYVEKICCKYRKKDKRIKYNKLKKNKGISENTNAALAMASGDYIALLDHDDMLHSSALFEYMNVICNENADYIYCDELTFENSLNKIITMHFKPDYAVDNLRANNYICHFSVFKKALLDKVGGFRKEFDGSQDHDMILRLTEQAQKIIHIPKILYFWRSHPNSVAADVNSKSYAIEAGKKAVKEHLERNGINGVVESSAAFPTIYRIKYDIPKKEKVSIIIPNCNHMEDLRRCIHSIQKLTTYINYELLIIENNSSEASIFDYYKKIESNQIKIINWEKPFNYSAINNYAATFATGKYLLFLNNDTEVIEPTWIEELIMYAQRDDVGAVGAKLYYPDDTIQHAGIILGMGTDGVAGHGHYRIHKSNLGYMGRLFYAQNVCAVTAACMMIKADVFTEVNGFDEQFAIAYNDVDLCMRALKAGYLNVFNPYAQLYHYESISRGGEDTPEKSARFKKEVSRFKDKWGKELEQGDPYYNPNLALDRSDFFISSSFKH